MITRLCPCDCTGSPFVDKDRNHIITGNLKFFDNSKLRKLSRKDFKYRKNRIVDYQKAGECMITRIKAGIQSWCDKCGVSTCYFLNGEELWFQ